KGNALVITLCALGGFLALGGILIGLCISNYNAAVQYEASIEAKHKDSENVLATYSLKVVEASGVAKAHKKDMVEYVTAAMQGRYGENGSQASWQWIKENNPSIDPSLRMKVMQIVDGGRANFEQSQRVKLDVC